MHVSYEDNIRCHKLHILADTIQYFSFFAEQCDAESWGAGSCLFKWLLLMFILLACHCLLSCVSFKCSVQFISAAVHTPVTSVMTVNSKVFSCRTACSDALFFRARLHRLLSNTHRFLLKTSNWKIRLYPNTLNISRFLNTAFDVAALSTHTYTHTHLIILIYTPECHS